MLSPRATSLLLRYFDNLDRVLSRKLYRKNPWAEEAITAFLCDLLDADTQAEEAFEYPLETLLADLAATDEPLSFHASFNTHKYPRHLESYVTQADIGLIVSFQDQFEPQNSFSYPWLLQAKRLFPNQTYEDGLYDAKAVFASRDAAQEERMRALRDWAGYDFIRYLLYCPRPASLRQSVREVLSHHRSAAIARDLFDCTLGLLLFQDALSTTPSTAAGVFIAPLDSCPKNLGEVHRRLMDAATPLAWFFIQHFAEGGGHPFGPEFITRSRFSQTNVDSITRLVQGDHRVLRGSGLEEHIDPNSPPRILPVHTIEIQVISGTDR